MVLSQDKIKESIKTELAVALTYFVERQKLVAQALTDMGLDLNEIGEFGAIAWAGNSQSENTKDDIKKQIAKTESERVKKMLQLALRASERRTPQSGIWIDSENNEWKYFLHGRGCRLTNIKTGEPIDWDCPDVNKYDKWKFIFHLMWQISSSTRADKLSSVRGLTRKSLEVLIDEIRAETPL